MCDEDHQLMRISEVIALLAVSKTQYYELRNAGKLGPVVGVGERAVRHLRSYVHAFIDASGRDDEGSEKPDRGREGRNTI